MQYKRLRISLLFLFGIGLATSQGQESINTSGGKAVGNGGSVSYSIGQTLYATYTGEDGSLAQGVQQAFEISVLGIEEIELSHSLTIYPNPTADYITLEVKELAYETLSFQIFDIQGKLLKHQNITENKTNINMSSFPVATYFVKITEASNEVKTFKIIKN